MSADGGATGGAAATWDGVGRRADGSGARICGVTE
jgi:hypothetical protein